MEEFTAVFKALGDPTRLRLVRLLLEAGTELCVCELADSLEESQYNVSKQCAVLKAARLLESRREGRWVYYRLASGREQFHALLYRAVSDIPGALIKRDRAELQKRLRLRQGGKCLLGVQKIPAGSARE